MNRWLRITRSEIRCELLKAARNPAFSVPTLAFPVLFYTIFALLLDFAPGIEQFALAGYGTFGVISPALFGFGVGVASERSAGWLLLKHASPMPPSSNLVARTVMAMIFAALVTLALFVLASGAGGVRMPVGNWLALAAILVAGVVPFCAMGLAIGLRVPGSAAAGVVNLVYLPMAVLSGLWFPLHLLPPVLQQLAWAFPPFHLGQLAFKAVDMDLGHPWWWHVLMLAAYALGFGWLALRAWRSDDKGLVGA